MEDFQSEKRKKLSDYKLKNLTTDKGEWRTIFYDHILPISQNEKMIIENIRKEFWTYQKLNKIKLHQYFHHLNSSQALCFNLFFPLFHYDKKNLEYVFENLLNIYRGEFEKCEFEKIIDGKEFTNFDFYVQHSDNQRTLFEIKYTERKFASVSANRRHLVKYHEIYEPRLSKILKPEFVNQNFIFSNYQIVRNLSYVDEKTSIVFLFPKANQDLKTTEHIVFNAVKSEFLNNVKIVYLEDLISHILIDERLKQLHPIFKIFKRIYID